ncbi:DUF4286 family protein [bacterium]|nr:MAG: DUF4286 family protein [bacterium]
MIYSVTITVQADLVNSWLNYMQKKHIQEVIDTGCFSHAKIYQSEEELHTFRIDYFAHSKEDLDIYFERFAEHLRADHVAHFPNGLKVSRAIWTSI